MSLLNNLLSSIDPTTAPKSPVPGARQTQAAAAPRAAPRPSGASNGISQTQPLKRKADSQSDGGQTKIQRRNGTAEPTRPSGVARPAPTSDATKTKSSTSANPIPYRGTAGTGGLAVAKPSNTVVKKPVSTGSNGATASKPGAPTSKTAEAIPASTAAPIAAKRGSYAAMLQKAKEVQQAKPASPPVKHEPTKILTKKERLALKAEASAAAKGKRPAPNAGINQARVGSAKSDLKEKRKPAELGYQGTARPKKPVEIGYKGTARPSTSAGAQAGKAGGVGPTKPKAKQAQGRWDGYAPWSDLDDDTEGEEEEDYNSEGSSDMEGGMWDVEKEEQLALKAAKKEDAEELAKENAYKREKEERRRRLEAMNKAAAAKRKY